MSKFKEDNNSLDVYEALQKGEFNYKQRPTDDHAEYGHEEHSFGYPPAQ